MVPVPKSTFTCNEHSALTQTNTPTRAVSAAGLKLEPLPGLSLADPTAIESFGASNKRRAPSGPCPDRAIGSNSNKLLRGSVTARNYVPTPRNPWPYPFIRYAHWSRDTHQLKAQLNGAHGEFTGSDDVENRNQRHQSASKKLQSTESQQLRVMREMNSTVQKLVNASRASGPRAVARPTRTRLPQEVPHTSTFAQAVLSPSAVARGTVHAPVHPPVMTQKCTLTAKGTMIPNGDGRSNAIIRPVTVRDRNNIVLTTSSAALADTTGTAFLNVAQAGHVGVNNNSPALFADFGPTAAFNVDKLVECRINVLGVKLRYVGPADKKSGSVYVYHSHTNDDVSNVSKGQVTANGLTRRWLLADSNEVEYSFLPSAPSDYQMVGTHAPMTQPDSVAFWDYSTASVAGGSATIAVCAYGMQSDAYIEVEVTTHAEFSGPQFEASSTMMHVSSSELDHAMEMHSAVTMAHLSGDKRGATQIATAHHIEGVAATAAQAAVALGVPGAGLALAGDKFLMGKKGTALTSAVGAFLGGKRR